MEKFILFAASLYFSISLTLAVASAHTAQITINTASCIVLFDTSDMAKIAIPTDQVGKGLTIRWFSGDAEQIRILEYNNVVLTASTPVMCDTAPPSLTLVDMQGENEEQCQEQGIALWATLILFLAGVIVG